jgi:hypothetical protein
VRTRCVALSPTERQWGAATTEGLLLYSLDEGLVFDPTDLGQDITPQAVQAALASKQPLRALLIALRLRDPKLLQEAILGTPPSEVHFLAPAWQCSSPNQNAIRNLGPRVYSSMSRITPCQFHYIQTRANIQIMWVHSTSAALVLAMALIRNVATVYQHKLGNFGLF